jgi:hypothetical protein
VASELIDRRQEIGDREIQKAMRYEGNSSLLVLRSKNNMSSPPPAAVIWQVKLLAIEDGRFALRRVLERPLLAAMILDHWCINFPDQSVLQRPRVL